MRPGIVSLVAASLALVTVPTAVGAPRTGVLTGQVTRPATTIQCVAAPCLEPAPNIVLTILRDGLVVARPRTDPEGRFKLSLLPGRYAIRNPRLAADRVVRVVVGGTARADLRIGDPGAVVVGGAASRPEG